MMQYDPNYTYDDDNQEDDANMSEEEEGWGSEFDEDEDGMEDDDDTSWKVRRAAVKAIEAIIGSRPEVLKEIYNQVAK
jgi:cullin-associated NEDD8-dissociated protein 1